ncbi:type II secretion system protein [Acetobacter sacchari]|uniref:Type II secretion system protein n=1 Tax=Acetobacter sacchari TaxID=2661687 RepID=A0ABS3LVG5_9PROT|nr:type II secretion system protein [Acetobacter sacchari]MBO1359899.1 type II secretion system protein [Acetobacter sacchari]
MRRDPSSFRRSLPDAGFTLLEVIVALMIASMALAVMFGAMETGLSGNKQADMSLRAVSVARSQLDAMLASPRLHPGTNDYVVNGGYRTFVEIRQISTGGGRSVEEKLGLYTVDVTVDWGALHHSVKLSGRAVRPATATE